MKSKLLILFSHSLTDSQRSDIRKNLKIKESHIVQLPDNLKTDFSNVPPDLKSIKKYAGQLIGWIKKKAEAGDYVLIQGDYGVTYLLVDFCLKNHFVPLYATTERIQQEEKNPDGSITIKKFFTHKLFRRYEPWEG
jgi:hypothetical protein